MVIVLALEPILEKLVRAQHSLLRTADGIPAEQWKVAPGAGAWSAAELVAHLMMVERAIIGRADRVLRKPPERFSLLKRWHLPLSVVEGRWIRRKTPIPLDPELVREKEEMLAELREVRERSRAFLDETKGRDLSAYRWRHEALGTLNMYEWFELIALHELRHVKQLREIAASLAKNEVRGEAALQK